MAEGALLEAPAATPNRFADYDALLQAPSPAPSPDLEEEPSAEPYEAPPEENRFADYNAVLTPPAPIAPVAPVQNRFADYESVLNNTVATDTAMKVTKATVDLAVPESGFGDLPLTQQVTPDEAHAGITELYFHDVASNITSSVSGLFRGMAELPTLRSWEKEPLEAIAEAVETYRTDKLLPSYQQKYGVTPEALASTKGQVAGAAAIGTDIAAGPARMITKMAGHIYNEAFNAGQERARQKGVTDPEELRHAGQVQARIDLAINAPLLVLYGYGNLAAIKGVEKLAPAAGPALRGALATVGTSIANMGVSTAARVAQGGELVGDLKQYLVDIIFGGHAGGKAALTTPKGRVADATKVKSTGAKVGGPEGARVDERAPLHERAKEPAGARREEEVRPSKEAEKAPDVSDVSLTPNDLGTALLDAAGKIREQSARGDAVPHEELMRQAMGREGADVDAIIKDFEKDATHIFMYGDRNELSREQAGKALGLDKPLDSSDLIKLQKAPAAEVDTGVGIHAVDLPKGNPLGLRPAFRYPDGTKVVGLPGQIHADIFRDFSKGKALPGFVDKNGNFLTRDEATKATREARAAQKKHVLVQDKVYSGRTIGEAVEKAWQDIRPDLSAEEFIAGAKATEDYREMTDAELKEHEAVSKVKAKRTAEQEAAVEEAKRIDEERAAKEKKAERKAETEAERQQNREEARLNWDANPIVRFIIDDVGGILSKSEYQKRVDRETFAKNKSEYEGAPEFSKNNPLHNQIYSRTSGRTPNKVAQDLADKNLLPEGATASDMWQVLRDLSEKSAEALKRNRHKDLVHPEDYIPTATTHVFEHGAMGAEKFGVLHGGRKPIRLANEDMDAFMIARGMEPRVRQARRGNELVWDTAMSRIEADRTAPERLVDEINAGERESTSDVQEMMILHEEIRLRNERQMEAERAVDRNESADLRKEARDKMRAIDDRLGEVHAAAAIAGTQASHSLSIRKQFVFDDYTFEVVKLRHERLKGDELTPKEEEAIRDGVAKIDKTKRDWVKAEDDASREHAMETLAKLLKEHLASVGEVKKGKTLLEGLHSARDAALARAKERKRQGRLFTGVDPEALLDATIIGASHIADGLARLGKVSKEWSNAMVRDLGEKVRPFLDQIFNLSKDYHEAARRTRDQEQAAKVRAKKPEKRKPTPSEKVEGAAEAGEALTKKHVFDLAHEYVKEGMTELDPIMREVTKDLQEFFPGITEREVRDLFVDYGKVRYPSQEADARTMREIRRQGQLKSAIEDVGLGKAPLASGSKRDAPSQKVREMTRQLKEDMRAAGIESGMSEAKLKGTHDAIKTGLRNRIQDLTKAISDRRAIVAEQKTKIKRDDIEIQLTKVRDALQKEYDKIFKKRGLTEDEILARALKFQATKLRRMNDLIDIGLAKLATGAVKARKREVKVDRPLSPELEAAKQELEKVNQMISEAREALKPPPKTALEKYKAYLDKKLADLKARKAAKNYAKPTRKETELDNEALRKKADVTLAQREIDALGEKARLDAQHIVWKVRDVAVETTRFSRSLMTSFDLSAVGAQGGMYTFAHPIRAAKIFPDMLRAMGHPTAKDFVTFFPHPIRTVKGIGKRAEQFQQMVEEEIRARPSYPLMVESKLFLGSSSELTRMEEVYQSNLQKHVPIVAGSGRAFTTFLMRYRADAFDMMLESLPFGRKPTAKEARSIANAINVFSGRASLAEGNKGISRVVGDLNGIMFAPRLAYSRFQTILGQPFWGKAGREGGAAARKVIATEYARALMGGAVVMSLLLLAGGTLAEVDWRSSDFGKIRFGNTRVDIFWGLLPASVFLGRLFGKTRQLSKIKHPKREPSLGPFVDLRPERRGKVKSFPLGMNLQNFFRNKLAPIPGAMWDAQEILTDKKTPPGHGKTLTEVGLKLTVPINPGDIADAMNDRGIARGTVLGVIGTLGARLNTYQEEQSSGLPKMKKSRGSAGIAP